MLAKTALEMIAEANPGHVGRLAEDVKMCLPHDFELRSQQILVISEFFGDYANSDYDPNKQGYRIHRSLYIMQITNFITLNGQRIAESDRL